MAVCCSSASLVSLNSRAFRIAISAWSRKDFGLCDLYGPENIGSFSHQREQTDALSLAKQRQVKRRIHAVNLMNFQFVFGQIDVRPVRQMQHFFVEDRA